MANFMIEFNPNSDEHISILLFGGTLKEKCRIPIVDASGKETYYKTGKQIGEKKEKWGIKEVVCVGLRTKPDRETETKKAGIYKTDEQTLQGILTRTNNTDTLKIINLLQEYRRLEKEISTYYISTLEQIEDDKVVRTQFQHCKTQTCRLSSKGPNIQNQPRTGVLLHFISRYL